jgi:putative PIN family toxin of toxin-antitoxin system
MSEDVLSEIDEVLRRPIIREVFPMLDDQRATDLISWVREYASFLDPVEHKLDYPTDPKDEPYLDLAIAAGAVYLVSWDKHIKRLGTLDNADGKRFTSSFPRVSILDPKEFLVKFFAERG